jgi:integrase
LGAHTGQRGSDLVRVGPTDVEIHDGRAGICLRQAKTGREVWIPIVSALADAIATWERVPGPWLRHLDGRPWTRRELTKAWIWERDHNPALAPLRRCGPDKDQPLRLHGLRGHACVSLLRAGCTTRQVSDVVGMSEQMVARYTRLSAQRDNATAAIVQLEGRMALSKTDKGKSKPLK